MDGLTRAFTRQRQEMGEIIFAEQCIVATTATDADDEVLVLLPNSEDPRLRVEVRWRPSSKYSGGTVAPLYPERGDEGLVVYDDLGELWLLEWEGDNTGAPVSGGGGGGSDKYYLHTQGAPAASWVVNHNLGKYPTPEIMIADGPNWKRVYVGYVHNSLNTLTITHTGATTGLVACN